MGSILLNRFVLAVVWTVDYVEAASKQKQEGLDTVSQAKEEGSLV